MKFLKVRCLKLLLYDISSTEFLYNRINKNKMIEISRRRMDTFRCEILRINLYSVARSCQRTLESLISMRGFWCTSGCVTSRYGFHGSPTIPRRHELERIGRSSFQKKSLYDFTNKIKISKFRSRKWISILLSQIVRKEMYVQNDGIHP